jgi:predicted ATP-dependent Lon-type protease
MRSLAETLQVAMDNGASKALIPLENNLAEDLPADVYTVAGGT